MYDALILSHAVLAVLSGSGFVVRGVWRILDSDLLALSFVRIAPHVVDALLLSLGVLLAIWSRQSPFDHSWLGVKLLVLLAYIGAGVVMMRVARTRPQQVGAFVAALGCFGYLLAVALTRSPTPWA